MRQEEGKDRPVKTLNSPAGFGGLLCKMGMLQDGQLAAWVCGPPPRFCSWREPAGLVCHLSGPLPPGGESNSARQSVRGLSELLLQRPQFRAWHIKMNALPGPRRRKLGGEREARGRQTRPGHCSFCCRAEFFQHHTPNGLQGPLRTDPAQARPQQPSAPRNVSATKSGNEGSAPLWHLRQTTELLAPSSPAGQEPPQSACLPHSGDPATSACSLGGCE